MRSFLVAFLAVLVQLPAQEAVHLSQPINEWQILDQRVGLAFPWFTAPFLEVLASWDIKDWDVFEWGGGYSTVWFAHQARSVTTTDSDLHWLDRVQKQLNELGLHNAVLKYRAPGSPPTIGHGGENSPYVLAIDEDNKRYDCIVIDGSFHRNTCALHLLDHIKENGIIILDNANQASVGLDSTATFELLKKYEHHSYLQPGHPDWRTDYWIIRNAD